MEEAFRDSTELVTWSNSLPDIPAGVVAQGFIVTTLVLCIFIIIGNSLILITLKANHQLRDEVGLLIISLTFTDLLVGITMGIDHLIFMLRNLGFIMPSLITITYKNTNMVIAEAALFSSMFHILLIAVDRLLSIVRPLTYTTIVTKALITKSILVSFSVSLVVGGISWWSEQQRKPQVRSKAQVAMFSLTVAILSLCYGKMAFSAMLQRRRIAALDQAHQAPKNKISRFLFTVIGVFVILWLPQIMRNILELNGVMPHSHSDFILLANVVKTFAMANSGVNVLIYSLLNSNFRRVFISLFTCQNNSP